MNWQRIDTNISFSDPESSFQFRTVDAGVELEFRDWQDRLIRFRFQNVSHFQFSHLCTLSDFPGEGLYTIKDSRLVTMLRECLALGQTEPASHYVVTHNEDEWCGIVAESYRIAIDNVDA
jgi:hypothetical protein